MWLFTILPPVRIDGCDWRNNSKNARTWQRFVAQEEMGRFSGGAGLEVHRLRRSRPRRRRDVVLAVLIRSSRNRSQPSRALPRDREEKNGGEAGGVVPVEVRKTVWMREWPKKGGWDESEFEYLTQAGG